MVHFIIIGDGAFASAMMSMISTNVSIKRKTQLQDQSYDQCQDIWIIPCVPAFAIQDALHDYFDHIRTHDTSYDDNQYLTHYSLDLEKLTHDKENNKYNTEYVDKLYKFIHEHKYNHKVLLISKGMSGSITPCQLIENMNMSYAVLAGPHLAQEIIDNLYTETSIACDDHDFQILQHYFTNIRPFQGKKTLQLCSIMKNIIAYAAGFMNGKNNGKNAIACMITNALRELCALCHEIYPDEQMMTINEILSPGVLGDLLLSATSSESRNFKCGFHKATYQKNHDAITIEAVYSANHLYNMISHIITKYPTINWCISCIIQDDISDYAHLYIIFNINQFLI